MDEMLEPSDIIGVKRDLEDIKKALSILGIIQPRFGEPFYSLPLAVQKVMESGGFEPFPTEAELLASTPTVSPKAAKAMDTKKIWYWGKYEGETVDAWHDTGLSELDQALAALDKKIGNLEDLSTVFPLILDQLNQSALWLDADGNLGFADLASGTRQRVKDGIGIGVFNSSNGVLPVLVDAIGQSPFWLRGGKIGFAGLADETIVLLQEILSIDVSTKKNNVTNAAYPIVSDGASLTQWRAKAARLKTGTTQQLKVTLAGDSWTEHSTIATQLMDTLRSEYGVAGSGWINIAPEQNMLDGVGINKSGSWSIYDLNTTTNQPIYGCGPDGFSASSGTAGSKINLSNLVNGDQLTIFYGNSGGTFSYKLNGGSATNVVSSTSDNNVKSVTISGLIGTNAVEIEVISGTVAIHGFHLRKTSGSGVELNKCGNGGATGEDYIRISPTYPQKYASFLSSDLVVMILGTNDYRLGKTVQSFKDGITKLISAYRAVNANCGIILIAPARSNATQLTPLSEFQKAIYELALENRAEYYNMYDDWNTWSVENVNDQWDDYLHINTKGALRLSKKLFKSFLEI
ncbi:GDSL-type esterase/lipase family protein [Acinetobacter pittii]|uniref:GDSL-type esterase/lipase family protein n=1 Tax=Acinetobacter pittii TaxID=48296 RepID=UPI001EEB980F|nr:GDSL-type esterase/lipase family protein [Acinetobacter pittii]